MSDADPCADLVDRLAEEFLTRFRRGERPAVQDYAAQYPECADRIRDLFPALVVLEQAAPASDPEPVSPATAPAAAPAAGQPEQLGDYRILREIGRGGMGVVYEAEQQSLGRRIALKVLPGPAAQDARLLARFRRESRAAAQLHHTNIVPVYEVGQQGGQCYYAMQFIRGQALDDVIRELQHLRAGSGHQPAPETAAALPDRSELSSVASNFRRYCHNVARLGLQAAEALAYAHGRGIVHRDIKPANLLLDTIGVLWVSDFGLVKTQDPALTETGDLVGTLRYMAPERFKGECDARADVYALGLTLYELLALRPAFDAPDRLHLIEQIGRQEPARLRTLDPRIPRDLETILMKTIEKDPRRRYPSADELAADLRRYLADEPIKARRTGPLERLGRWGRRNPVVAGLSAAVVLVAALGFAGVFGQMQVAWAHAADAEQKEKEAQKERDEVKALNEKLRAAQDQLRRTLYAAQINLAQHAWDKGGVRRVRELLEQHRPKEGESDLRGFEWYYLYRLSHTQPVALIEGHTDAVQGVAYSPDGKRLASASADRTVKVWDAQTGQELFTLKGHKNAVRAVVFSPDGKRLASAGGPSGKQDGEVKVWDAQTGQELLTLKGHSWIGNTVAFSPDGKRLATTGNPDGKQATITVWDAQTGQQLLALKHNNKDLVCSVAFSSDGKRLATVGGTPSGTGPKPVGEVKVWDAQTGQELLTFKSLTTRMRSVAFSPDGKHLATTPGLEHFAEVWDAQTGNQLFTLKGHADRVYHVAYSPDGKQIATASADWTVKLWDAQTGQELRTFKGHNGAVEGLAFSPDSERLASASSDQSVMVWIAKAAQQVRTLKHDSVETFSRDGMRLVTKGNGLTVWDLQTGQKLLALQNNGMMMLTVSPDGKHLAAANAFGGGFAKREGDVDVWDVLTGQKLYTLKGDQVDGKNFSSTTIAFSEDSSRLARGTSKELTVFDVKTGQVLRAIKGGVYMPAFSPDGKRLAGLDVSDRPKGTVKVWDAQTGKELLAIKVRGGTLYRVAYSPDGKRLASKSGFKLGGFGEVKVWDAQTGLELFTLNGRFRIDSKVAFSPDGKRLAINGKVWDAQTGQELLTLRGHIGAVNTMVFSPDGQRLATAASDATVKVWDAQTGQELLTFEGHSGAVNGVAFSPDGHRLAAGSSDGTVRIWDATPLPGKR